MRTTPDLVESSDPAMTPSAPAATAEPTATATAEPTATAASGCPMHLGTTAIGTPAASTTPQEGVCPFPHGGSGPSRSKADYIVRRILRIPDQPKSGTDSDSKMYRSFSQSMMISAIRCTLTYVVFPLVLPAVGFATGVGPILGILIGVFAMVCDVYTIRRFFIADHKWRWPVATIAVSVMSLLAVLLVQDIAHLIQN